MIALPDFRHVIEMSIFTLQWPSRENVLFDVITDALSVRKRETAFAECKLAETKVMISVFEKVSLSRLPVDVGYFFL
jgi:hypothetical protein